MLLLLAACGANLQGSLGFPVDEGHVIPCLTDRGDPGAMVIVVSTRSCWRSEDAGELCPSFFELYGQDQSICDAEQWFQSDRTRTVTTFLAGADRDDLAGAAAPGAWVAACRDGPDAPFEPGQLTVVGGSVEVVEDRGETALVSFQTDGLQGDVELAVCR